MARKLNPLALDFLDRLKDAIERTSALGRVSFWLEKNTRLAGKPYRFNGHECQREIIDSTHPNVSVSKPSQVGMSEGIARLALGFLAVSQNIVSIYTLPTVHEALRFAKSRMDPIIRDSKHLSEAMMNGNDSSSFKQIGTSQLFMAGTFGKALISIPTDLLINDEVDFSNPEVLITAESRLTHSRFYDEDLDIRGIRRKFSTPTLPQVGISAMVDKSDRRHRLVKCKHCGHWFWPNFLHHVVVTGYDGTMDKITYAEVQDLQVRGLIETARLLCESCHEVITRDNLQPEYREWVAENPSVTHARGYIMSPFDIPDYHTPVSLLRKKLDYKEEEGHFRNFTLGLPHADASNSVLHTAVADNTCLTPMYPDSAQGYGLVAGLDVGKTSWLTIGKVVDGDLHVLWAEQIRIGYNQEDMLFSTVVERLQQFHAVKGVGDAMPYTDTMLRIQKKFIPGQFLLCSYGLRDQKVALYVVRESDNTVEANRTKSLDTLVKSINTNRVKFARFPDLDIMTAHLQGMKRVDRVNTDGQTSSDWVKTGPDHYFHSLNYLNIAAKEVTEGWSTEWSPGVGIVQAHVGSKAGLELYRNDPGNLFRR